MHYIEDSSNAKLGPGTAATMLPLSTCPAACPLRDAGCYAQQGNVAIHERRLSRESPDAETALAREFAEVVAARPRGRRLRFHVSGDVRHARDAARVGLAADTEAYVMGMRR